MGAMMRVRMLVAAVAATLGLLTAAIAAQAQVARHTGRVTVASLQCGYAGSDPWYPDICSFYLFFARQSWIGGLTRPVITFLPNLSPPCPGSGCITGEGARGQLSLIFAKLSLTASVSGSPGGR